MTSTEIVQPSADETDHLNDCIRNEHWTYLHFTKKENNFYKGLVLRGVKEDESKT